MKIAFVGKGGSGKSTVSSLFVRHLTENNQKVLAVDADINQHFASLIGADFDSRRALSHDKNKRAIREYLIGSNKRIAAVENMIKTTPPGIGSNLVTLHEDNMIIRNYSMQFAPGSYFIHVGTYQDDGIGISCYHTSLSILENVLSHSDLADDDWIVADMVAGTDAFSGPLHAMFDLLYIVVEPTVESVAVYKQFIGLANKAGVSERVRVVINKVEDEDDVSYVKNETGATIVSSIHYNSDLRKQRRTGDKPSMRRDVVMAMKKIEKESRDCVIPADEHLKHLHRLHSVFARQKFTINKYGDTTGQIDSNFTFPAKVKRDV